MGCIRRVFFSSFWLCLFLSCEQALENSEDTQSSLKVHSLEPVNIKNAGSYTLTGSCSTPEGMIHIVINDGDPKVGKCTDYHWQMELNLRDGDLGDRVHILVTEDSHDEVVSYFVDRDVTTPEVRWSPLPPVNSSNANRYPLSASCSEPGKIEITVGEQVITDHCENQSWETEYDFSSLNDGEISLLITMVDLMGNPSNKAMGTLHKDTHLPR